MENLVSLMKSVLMGLLLQHLKTEISQKTLVHIMVSNRIILCCKENDPGYVFLVFQEKCHPLMTPLKEHMILFCVLIHSVTQTHSY